MTTSSLHNVHPGLSGRGVDKSPGREAATQSNGSASIDSDYPNRFVQWVFCLSAFAIPFGRLYLPGTGERVGVVRLIQALILIACLWHPRLCLRRLPLALFWFLAYCILRVAWGLWLTPELAQEWWPTTLGLLQFCLPWMLFLFNVLHFQGMAKKGLWGFAIGSSLCALLHIAGINTDELDNGLEGRTSIFGENANVVGATYGLALIAMFGLLMLKDTKPRQCLVLLTLMGLVGLGLTMTGSRTSALLTLLGVVVLGFRSHAFASGGKRFAILLLMATVLGVVLYKVPTVLKRVEILRSSDSQEEPRARMFPVLWEMILRKPIFGGGPDYYQDELTRRAMPYLLEKHRTISAHNLVLLLLVETGLLGLIVFGRGVAAAIASAWRGRLNSCGLLPLAMFVPLIIVGTISSDPHYNKVFWFAMAYALAARG